MRVLSDIAVFGRIEDIAALAPPEEEHTRKPQPRPSAGGRESTGASSSLGPLDVAAYLDHYGIQYNIKREPTRTIYRLHQCLFDPAHGRNEASIIQDLDGVVAYQCFHDSCAGRKWSEARTKISGDDSLAPFCDGYDPNWKPKRRKKNTAKTPPPSPPSEEKPSPMADLSSLTDLPSPDETPIEWFFEGKRFIPPFLARYLEAYFDPLIYDGAYFYHYNGAGVWKVIEDERIARIGEQALKKEARSARTADAMKQLGNRVFRTPDQFQNDARYLNLENGMLEIATLELLPHDPKYYSRIQLPVRLNRDAECPRWIQFLEEIFPEDPEKAKTLQSYFGYCLLPDCRYQKCLFLVGSGANGKSVTIDILVGILGEENVCSLPLQLFGERFLIGQLRDKLVNVASELSTNRPVDTANFKDAVTGGLLMADQKHGKPFSFYPIAKHIFSMNEVPKITDKSYGFQRRPIVLTFNERFEGSRRDPQLTKKLLAERDGIFNWMLEGLYMVLERDDLYVADSVEKDTALFVKSTNPVLLFVEDCCILSPAASVKPKHLYNEYKAWCEEGKNRPLSRNRFYDQIMIHFPSIEKRQTGELRERKYHGIGLLA